MEKKNYITPVGFEKLKAEYSELLHKERPKVVEVVAWAASNGDRSENADYQYGKKRLREIDHRLHFLNQRLDSAEVVDPAKVQSDKIVFGATVEIEKENGETKVIKIVGEDEIDIEKGFISWKSPMAQILIGKKTGECVNLQKPASNEELIILSINYI